MTKTEKTPVVVEGVLMYPNLYQPQTRGKYPSNKYQVEITQLSDASIKALTEAGLGDRLQTSPKFDPTTGEEFPPEKQKGTYITPKSKIRIGQYGPVFQVFENNGEVMTEERLAKLGNGSKAKAIVEAFKNSYDGSITAGLSDIRVIDYVEYEGSESPEASAARSALMDGADISDSKADLMSDNAGTSSGGWSNTDTAA